MAMESNEKFDLVEINRVEYLNNRNNHINEYAWMNGGLVFLRIKQSSLGILTFDVYQENQCPWDI